MITAAEIARLLERVLDPEVGINIVDLGLVYGISTTAERSRIELTMTTPACPLSDVVTEEAREVVAAATKLPVEIELVWNPPWSPEFLSNAARKELGW
jgi:metal-sulfur cluster biosynthetic enzyme